LFLLARGWILGLLEVSINVASEGLLVASWKRLEVGLVLEELDQGLFDVRESEEVFDAHVRGRCALLAVKLFKNK